MVSFNLFRPLPVATRAPGRRPDTSRVWTIGPYFRYTTLRDVTTLPQFFKVPATSTRRGLRTCRLPRAGAVVPHRALPDRWPTSVRAGAHTPQNNGYRSIGHGKIFHEGNASVRRSRVARRVARPGVLCPCHALARAHIRCSNCFGGWECACARVFVLPAPRLWR